MSGLPGRVRRLERLADLRGVSTEPCPACTHDPTRVTRIDYRLAIAALNPNAPADTAGSAAAPPPACGACGRLRPAPLRIVAIDGAGGWWRPRVVADQPDRVPDRTKEFAR